MNLTEKQIEGLSPNPAAFTAGKKLSAKENWQNLSSSERAIWGAIKGSGKSPYLTQIDSINIAYKCTCPSRQFPCKHSIALLLLVSSQPSAVTGSEEPEWVKDWMDKRSAKEEKKAEPKELTEEEIEQRDRNKEKTQAARMSSVTSGLNELELWLKDLVRMGILDLPNKPETEFKKVASRMVDAKATGLAGWVRLLADLDYSQSQLWQSEALAIIAKLFLLIRALRNYDQLSPEWQTTLRGLSGWSQSPKELLENPEVETIKDEWICLGQENLTTEEDITIQRNWMLGIKSNRTALLLNFGTKFSAIENTVLPGMILEAELAWFPGVLPERAVIKQQRRVAKTWSASPMAFSSWLEVQEHKIERLRINPWSNDHIIVLQKARMINNGQQWMIADAERNVFPVVKDLDPQKPIRWLTLTGNEAVNMTLVIRNNRIIPLGIIKDNQYLLL